jgi:hypothetical protein
MTHHRNRQGRHGAWWIPDEAPGGLGSPELWMDEAALDMYRRGDAEPAVIVRHNSAVSMIGLVGAVVRFETYPGLEVPVVYTVVSRQTSRANLGRPYYVLKLPE